MRGPDERCNGALTFSLAGAGRRPDHHGLPHGSVRRWRIVLLVLGGEDHPAGQHVRQVRLHGPLHAVREGPPRRQDRRDRRGRPRQVQHPAHPEDRRRQRRPATSSRSRRARSSTSSRAPTSSSTSRTTAPTSMKDQWLPWKYAQATTADGSDTIGLGTDVGGLAMCYRQDLFEKAGLPTDRDEVGQALADVGRLHRHRREVPGRASAATRCTSSTRRPTPTTRSSCSPATTPTSTPTTTSSSSPTRRSRRPGTSR